MKYIMIPFVVLMACACANKKKTLSSTQKAVEVKREIPSWVNQRPVSSQYYIGIGRSGLEDSDPMASAKSNALQDLASEIEVKIDANSLLYQIEKNESFKQDFLSDTKLKTKLQLEGYEAVDSYSDATGFYSYYRLDKAAYQELQRQKKLKALDKSTTYYTNATTALEQEKYHVALGNYINALQSIEPYLNEPMKLENEDGSTYFYDNVLYAELQSLLDKMQIQRMNPIVQTTPGFEVDREKTQVLVTDDKDLPISDIPIVFECEFLKKKLIAKSIQDGTANVSFGQISKKGSGEIKISLDVMSYAKTKSPLTEALLLSLRIPGSEIAIVSESPRVYIELELKHKDEPKSTSEVKNGLESALTANSFQYENNLNKAHYILKLKANSSEAGEYQGLFTTSLSGLLSVVRAGDGKVIFTENLSGIKGVDLNYAGASNKCYTSLSKELNFEIIPRLRRQIMVN